jgi:hypothetical protein
VRPRPREVASNLLIDKDEERAITVDNYDTKRWVLILFVSLAFCEYLCLRKFLPEAVVSQSVEFR